jgi:hypothetical protein
VKKRTPTKFGYV